MTIAIFSRNFVYSRIILPPSRLSYHAGTGANVHTAIARGLRKSKGIGFRASPAKESKPDDPRRKYIERNGLVHRTAEPRPIQREGSPMSRDGWKGKNEKNNSKSDGQSTSGGKSKRREMKIHRGIKLVKTDQELARKKPNPAGRSKDGGYMFGKQGGPRTPFEEDSKPRRFSNKRDSSDGRQDVKFRSKISQRSGRFGDRSSLGSSSTDSFGFKNRSDPVPKYPSLSAGQSSYRPRSGESKPQSRYPERRNADYSKGESSYDKPFYQQKQWEPKSDEKYSDQSSPNGFNPKSKELLTSSVREHVEDREAPGFSIRRGASVANPSPNQPPTAQLRTTKAVDPRIPLSVPYTTPASEFLYGTSVVEAALTSQRKPRRQHYKLYIYVGENRDKGNRDVDLERLARKNGVKVQHVTGDGLRLMDKMSGGRPHNGYILEASPLPRLPVRSLGIVTEEDEQNGFKVVVDYQSREDAAINGTSDFIATQKGWNERQPMVLLLDSIQDPGNLGGIIRTASFLGVNAVAISTRNSASLSPVVLKASAGASENITLFSVSSPESFIQESWEAGWKTYAAVAPTTGRDGKRSRKALSTEDLNDPLLQSPCILMLGSEGDGLRMNLKKKADYEIYIPGHGMRYNVDSLNVSVAAGILCNAFIGQSKKLVQAAPKAVEEADTTIERAESDLF